MKSYSQSGNNIQMSLSEAEKESGYLNENMARASVAEDQNGKRINLKTEQNLLNRPRRSWRA